MMEGQIWSKLNLRDIIYIRLSRIRTARGLVFIIKSLRMRRSLVKLSGFVKTVTKMVTGCLGMMQVSIFALCH